MALCRHHITFSTVPRNFVVIMSPADLWPCVVITSPLAHFLVTLSLLCHLQICGLVSSSHHPLAQFLGNFVVYYVTCRSVALCRHHITFSTVPRNFVVIMSPADLWPCVVITSPLAQFLVTLSLLCHLQICGLVSSITCLQLSPLNLPLLCHLLIITLVSSSRRLHKNPS